MTPRLTRHERLALTLLLALVAGAAGWRWWRISQLGRDSIPPPPPASFLEKDGAGR